MKWSESAGGDGRQAIADEKFFLEVFDRAVIQIGLHGAGARHHVPRARAARTEIRAHHAVASVGKPVLLTERAQWVKADGQKDERVTFGNLREPRDVAPDFTLDVL